MPLEEGDGASRLSSLVEKWASLFWGCFPSNWSPLLGSWFKPHPRPFSSLGDLLRANPLPSVPHYQFTTDPFTPQLAT